MIFWFFSSKIVFFFWLKYNHHCECFYCFVNFLGLIVAIWIRLIRLIGEKESKVLERGPITKIKIYNNYKK